MSVTRRSRLPGKVDPLAMSSTLLNEVLIDNPYAFWLCDDGSGAPTDKSGNSRHSTLSLGSNNYVIDPRHGTVLDMSLGLWRWPFRLPQAAYTLEAWIKIETPTGEQAPISDWGGDYSAGAMIYLSAMTLYGYHSASYISGGTLSINNWYHLVQTWNGSIMRLYVNGVQVNTLVTSATPGTANGPSNGAFFSGYGNTVASAKVKGKGRGFAVYTTALTVERILAHYAFA